jgi:hypothetical protein
MAAKLTGMKDINKLTKACNFPQPLNINSPMMNYSRHLSELSLFQMNHDIAKRFWQSTRVAYKNVGLYHKTYYGRNLQFP